jgi:lipopolysaccharide export system protein LptA
MFKHIFYIFTLFIFAANLFAQKNNSTKQSNKLIKIIHAESLSFDRELNDSKILSGNVQCEHEGAMLYCDTAIIKDGENSMQAKGHILITKGDSIRVTGDKLFYNGKTKLATLENNVKCIENDMTLTTNFLNFDVGNSVANYYSGGKIVNKQNTLVSKNGHYYSATKEATFHYDVVLTNPEYKMNSDTLRYKMNTKTAYFLGPSIILSQQDYIYCENGWYDTNKEKAQFSRNSLLQTGQQKLRGDSLLYDRKAKIGRAFKNVSLVDTAEKSTLYGDYIEYKEKNSEAFVTKRAIFARLIENDSVFIAADTLYHLKIDSANNFLNAFHHVKLFKSNLQASADSATMNTKDSLIQLFNTPILWSNRSQATAKIIKIDIGKKTIKGFTLDGKAFLIQEVDTLNKDKFNQLSGKKITSFIVDDTIRKAIINGNAEIYYYPKNKNKLIGLNKTQSSDIHLWFAKGDIARVTLQPKSSGVVDPIKEADIMNAKLKGFNWRYENRPKSRFELHK